MSGGLFITVEGGEGSGKSGVVSRLVSDLTAAGVVTVATREPGASPIGPEVRALLLNPDGPALDSRTEALLMAADRAEHVATVVRPALDAGVTVVSDRYFDSSVAYQGVARNLGARFVRDLSVWATQGTVPDVTVLLDVDPQVGLARRVGAGGVNRLDLEEMSFHQAVRDAFLWIASEEPERVVVVDASRDDRDAVYADVWAAVAPLLGVDGRRAVS